MSKIDFKVSKKSVVTVALIILTITVLSAGVGIINTKHAPEHRLQWWLDSIGISSESLRYTGEGIKIAILDTGVETSHVDLSKTDIECRRVGDVMSVNDDKSHGTAIAGIISAYPSHDKGVLGIVPDATIMSIDITDDEYAEPQNIIDGIKIAIDEQVDIISISLGLVEDSEELHEVIKEAYNLGITIVASAGNYMDGTVLYPAMYDEVICVGARGKDGDIISPINQGEINVLYAPGENIVTIATGEKEYFGATGTSFSTAIVTGIVAIMKDVNSNMMPEDFISFFASIDSQEFLTVEKCINYVREKK